jgi:hypothetical protein
MCFAKMITYELLEQLHMAFGPVAPRSYVDDMAMLVIEVSQAALYGALAPASMAFVTELAKMGLRVSAKSQMEPTGSAVIRQLQALLLRHGVVVEPMSDATSASTPRRGASAAAAMPPRMGP